MTNVEETRVETFPGAPSAGESVACDGVSIIIPLYNREKLVRDTLDSILRQTCENWECLVVDDRSTDGSAEAIAEYAERESRLRLLVRPEDRIKGAATCRNIGYENSSKEFVYFFDSDDLLDPRFLQTVLEEMRRHPAAGYATYRYSNFIRHPDVPVRRTRQFDPKKGPLFDQIIVNRLQANTPNFFWRRTLLEKAGFLWREGLRSGDDTDFVCRMICHADEGIWLDIPDLVHVRRHSESMGGRSQGKALKDVDVHVGIFRNIYDYCVEKGRMSSSLHRNFLRHVLRIQAINTLLHGDRHVSRLSEHLLRSLAGRGIEDRLILLLSHCLTWSAPALRRCGELASRMRIPGISDRLAVHKQTHDCNLRGK